MSFSEVAKSGLLGFILTTTINWNLLLAILNLLPIPPLDGSKLFALLLPDKMAASYLAFGNSGLGMFVLIALFFFPIGGFSLSSVIFTLITYSRSFLGF
jgi:Zn-dependent protease